MFRNKLSLRLAMWLVFAALLIQGADIGYRLWVDVPAARQQMLSTIDKAVSALHPVFRATLLKRDEALGQASLRAFEQYEAVQSVWLLDAKGEAVAAWFRHHQSDVEQWQEYRRPIYQQDTLVGYTVLELDPQPVTDQVMQQLWSVVMFSLFVTLVTLVLFYGIVQRIVTRPLKQLADIIEDIDTEHVAPGDLSRLQQVRAEGELKQLSESFQSLLHSLNQNILSRQQALIGLRKFAETLEEKVEQRTEELRHAMAEVEKSGKAKSDFLSVMTHELRTPLNGILGFTALLQKNTLDDRTNMLVQNIHESASKLLTIVSDMIDYVALDGIESFSASLFSPADAIVSACMSFEKQAQEKQIELGHDVDVNILMTGDGQRLSLMLRQLLSNAIKYTDVGSVHVQCKQHDNSVVIEVKDTGRGIDLDNMQNMLSAFSQGDVGFARTSEGIGMGLAIVSRICDIWGAEITFSHNSPQGTQIVIVLPLHLKTGQHDMTA